MESVSEMITGEKGNLEKNHKNTDFAYHKYHSEGITTVKEFKIWISSDRRFGVQTYVHWKEVDALREDCVGSIGPSCKLNAVECIAEVDVFEEIHEFARHSSLTV